MLPTKFQFIWPSGSEEKIKMWKVNERQRTDGRQVMAKAQIAFGRVS